MSRALVALTLAAALGAHPSIARAETTTIRELYAGAYLRLEVPDDWNGDLILVNRGIAPVLLPPPPPGGPLAHAIDEGFAVAGTSYSQTGWALFLSTGDVRNVVDRFRAHFGDPDRIFLVGYSLGALVSAAAIESGEIPEIVGALSLCGPLAGSRIWDAYLDLRLAYDAVCSDVPGAALPGGPAGLPLGTELTWVDVLTALDRCTGVLRPRDERSAGQSERLARLLQVARFDESFLTGGFVLATFGIADLTHDPGKLDGAVGIGNLLVEYDDPILDAEIERVIPDSFAALELTANYTPSGAVGDVKTVSLHTDKDGIAVVENESAYAAVVPPENLTSAVVVENVPTHCGLSNPEVQSAWSELRAWVDGAPQPSAADLQAACVDLGSPAACRIDPDFSIPDLDSRIRPRSADTSAASPNPFGATRSRSGSPSGP
jgi:hypothetical protein